MLSMTTRPVPDKPWNSRMARVVAKTGIRLYRLSVPLAMSFILPHALGTCAIKFFAQKSFVGSLAKRLPCLIENTTQKTPFAQRIFSPLMRAYPSYLFDKVEINY